MPPGSYSTITLAAAGDALSARLDDRSQIRWIPNEVQRYIQEALRTWNALTSTFRSTLVFNTNDAAFNTNTPFFDLPILAPTTRGYSLTTDDAVHLLEYHLLEAQSVGATWAGTDQFSYDDLVQALTRRRDQFLLETSARLSRDLIPIASPPSGRIPLPETIVTLRRLAWIALDGTVTPLQRDDSWGVNAYRPRWVQQPAPTPRVYSVSDTAPLYAQVVPPPNVSGTLDCCSVPRGAALTTTIPIGIPTDWVWVVMFGALADLLSRDGLALDAARATYCEQRWQHGVKLAQAAPVVLGARINNVVVRVGALPDADQFTRTWQTTTGQPRTILTFGQNLVSMVPPPSANAPSGWAVALDIVCNAPVPLLPINYLPIGPELLDTMLDYAQHLALFKEGAAELAASEALLDRFFRAAGVNASWQQALQPARRALLGQQSQDRRAAAPAHDPNSDVESTVAPGVTL